MLGCGRLSIRERTRGVDASVTRGDRSVAVNIIVYIVGRAVALVAEGKLASKVLLEVRASTAGVIMAVEWQC